MSETNNTVTPTPNPETPAPTVTYPARWTEIVGGFANDLKKPIATISTALVNLLGDPSDDGAELLLDSAVISDADLKTALTGVAPVAFVQKAINNLRKPVTPVAPPVTPQPAPQPQVPISPFMGSRNPLLSNSVATNLLPQVPFGGDFLSIVAARIPLSVDPQNISAAMMALVADQAGFFKILEIIHARVQQVYATRKRASTGSDLFYYLEDILTAKENAPLQKMLGYKISQRFTSDKEKEAFLGRMRTMLMPKLLSFLEELAVWYDQLKEFRRDPSVYFSGLGADELPDIIKVKDKAKSVAGIIDEVFGLHGIPCALSLVYEAGKVKEVIKDERLLGLFAVQNEQELLVELGIGVSLDVVRLQNDLAQLILVIVELATTDRDQITETEQVRQLALKTRTMMTDLKLFDNPPSSVLATTNTDTGLEKPVIRRDGSNKKGYNTY